MQRIFRVRHNKADLGFKIFIIRHIVKACQSIIFTVVVGLPTQGRP